MEIEEEEGRGRPATCYGFALLRFGGSKYGVTALLQIIRQRAVAVITKITQQMAPLVDA